MDSSHFCSMKEDGLANQLNFVFLILGVVLMGLGLFIEDYVLGSCLQSMGIVGFLLFIRLKKLV